MKITRSQTLALELDACGLIDNSTLLEAQAIISGLLLCNPELTDEQVKKLALEV